MIRSLRLPLISALFLIFASCSEKYFSNSGETWGTTYHIVYSAPADMQDSLLEVMRQVDAELSVFNPASTVRAVNENRQDSVGPRFARVFACAARVNALSGGLYDPTVAPLANLWGFGPDGDVRLPDSAEVAESLRSVGMQACAIDSVGRVFKKSPATAFDFSSLAKGFGVDCIGEMLERNGICDYMVEIGGEVRVRGLSPRGRRWRIQVDAPVRGLAHERYTVVELGPEQASLASSGNYRNYRRGADGRDYGHIVNPATGYPVRTRTLAATVAAENCMTADAFATAAMCMEPDSAMRMLGRAGVRGLVIYLDADTLVSLSTLE